MDGADHAVAEESGRSTAPCPQGVDRPAGVGRGGISLPRDGPSPRWRRTLQGKRMCQVWVGFGPTGSDLCSARSDGLRKTLRHLEFVENGVAGAAYGRRRDRVREVVFWCRDARIWQLRWSRRHAPPPGCLLGACGASGPARARRWRRRVDSAVPPCRRDPRRSAADAGGSGWRRQATCVGGLCVRAGGGEHRSRDAA